MDGAAPKLNGGLAVLSDKKKANYLNREKRFDLTDTLNGAIEWKDLYGNQKVFQVSNVSRFGARVDVDKDDAGFHINETLNDVSIKVNGILVFSGSCQIVNEKMITNGKISYGVSLLGDGIDIDQIAAIENGTSLDTWFTPKKLVELSQLVDPKFKVLVADLNTLFQELKSKLIMEEQRAEKESRSENMKKRMEEHAISMALSIYQSEIHKLFEEFSKIVDGVKGEELTVYKRYFRANFHPLVLGAPFVDRGFNKPLGYAGDYNLMVMLYQYEDIGSNLFEKFFHRFSCTEPASLANKNRVEYLSQVLYEQVSAFKEKEFKITSVACGPAREFELLVKDLIHDETNKELDLILIDQEENALDFARNRMRPLIGNRKNIKMQLLKEDAVLGIIKGREFTDLMRGSNCIVSAGLFDYLSDRVSQKLIDSFIELLSPGGIIYIGNVSKNNPDRFSMDFFTEWNLILRSERDLINLVNPTLIQRFDLSVEVVSESLGLNLFLVIKKRKAE